MTLVLRLGPACAEGGREAGEEHAARLRRSGERRVGKEGRSPGAPDHLKKKNNRAHRAVVLISARECRDSDTEWGSTKTAKIRLMVQRSMANVEEYSTSNWNDRWTQPGSWS